MRILFPFAIGSAPWNPLAQQLELALRDAGAEVIVGRAGLSPQAGPYDVVHFQWPEATFGWRDATTREWAETAFDLSRLRRTARIVTTVHNWGPLARLERGDALHRLIYGMTDDFIHLGQTSVAPMQVRFPGRRHHVVPHGDYRLYRTLVPDPRVADAVRQAAGYRVLVFGALREESEETLALAAFRAAGLPDAVLVFAGHVQPDVRTGVDTDPGPEPGILRFHGHIHQRAVAPLIEAVDLLLIPRHGRLNSGIVALAYTFDRPVVAPDEGVMAEQVRAAGGFLYRPGDAASAAAAIRQAAALGLAERAALKARVADYRHTVMDWRRIARQHLAIYAGEDPAGIAPLPPETAGTDEEAAPAPPRPAVDPRAVDAAAQSPPA